MAHASGPHTVYVARDADGRVLYVGNTCNLERRLNNHRSSSGWYSQMASVDTTDHPTWAHGHLDEAKKIRTLDPIWNRCRMVRPSQHEANIRQKLADGTWDEQNRLEASIPDIDFLTVSQVATALSVSDGVIRDRIRDGVLPMHRFPSISHQVILRSELIEYLRSGSLVVPA